MALSEHYEFRSLDPDAALSDFPSQWDHVIDKIDTGIHDAATAPVSLSRLPNLPASKTTSGKFAQARIPNLPASQIDSGRFPEARMPQDIIDRLDNIEEQMTRSTGARIVNDETNSHKVTSGDIVLMRVGNTVTFSMLKVKVDSEESGLKNLISLPFGFRPLCTLRSNFSGDADSKSIGIFSSWISITGDENSESTYKIILSWVTEDDWPSSMPGDPA